MLDSYLPIFITNRKDEVYKLKKFFPYSIDTMTKIFIMIYKVIDMRKHFLW